MLRRRWLLGLGALFVVVGGVLGRATVLHASDPATQDVSVPAAGATSTFTWTGTIPVGSHASSDCTTLPAQDPTVDHHGLTLHVPPTGYTGLQTTFTFSITWTPNNPTKNESVADEILTVVSKQGDQGDQSETRETGPSDPASPTETVVATNLAPGAYDA